MYFDMVYLSKLLTANESSGWNAKSLLFAHTHYIQFNTVCIFSAKILAIHRKVFKKAREVVIDVL